MLLVRIVALVVFIFLAITGIFLVMSSNARAGLTPTSQTAAAGEATEVATPSTGSGQAAADTFELTATLTYYPDNLGRQIPWIVYKTTNGSTATKSLAFDSASSCVTSSGTFPCALIADAFAHYYSSGSIRVIGTFNNESLVVDRVTPA
jgi:hypothetical protein